MLVTFVVSLVTACGSVEFNGNRTGNNSEFIMDYSVLNREEIHEMELQKDDVIDVNIESLSGELNVDVISIYGDKVYIGDNVETGTFQLNIPKSSTYIFRVNGKKAKGSISFLRVNK